VTDRHPRLLSLSGRSHGPILPATPAGHPRLLIYRRVSDAIEVSILTGRFGGFLQCVCKSECTAPSSSVMRCYNRYVQIASAYFLCLSSSQYFVCSSLPGIWAPNILNSYNLLSVAIVSAYHFRAVRPPGQQPKCHQAARKRNHTVCCRNVSTQLNENDA
jgi:hypothetical protein